MADLIYTPKPSTITRLLAHIQSGGIPDHLTTRYLSSLGLKSKNDRAVIAIMRAIGFIDGSQAPTQRWKEYRNKSRAKQVLGNAVREAYEDLFRIYPDAYNRDPDAIRDFFSARSSVADSTLRLAVATFKTLASEAVFDGEAPDTEPIVEPERAHRRTGPSTPSTPTPPSLSIAIQVYMDKDMTPEQVDHVFASMARHLYGKE